MESRAGLTPYDPDADLTDLHGFLVRADLTLIGPNVRTARLWLLRDAAEVVHGSTGFELSASGEDALIRSVAVDHTRRGQGLGLDLARFALERASEAGAHRAWLFSRRSGPFWRRLGFEPADRDALADALADTHQVTLFRATGQFDREVAWSRPLT